MQKETETSKGIHFTWTDHPMIGHYHVALMDGDRRLKEMVFWDNTCISAMELAAEIRSFKAYSFETDYCSGFSSRHGFDLDENYKKHKDRRGHTLYGYRGNCTHTVEDIKHWCEEFLAGFLLIDYEKELAKLAKRKAISDALADMGYTGNYEGKEAE